MGNEKPHGETHFLTFRLKGCVVCKFYWQDMKVCSVEPITFLGHKIKTDCYLFEIHEDIMHDLKVKI
jgi:hypothetical protein